MQHINTVPTNLNKWKYLSEYNLNDIIKQKAIRSE
jgi:hypothetical protein